MKCCVHFTLQQPRGIQHPTLQMKKRTKSTRVNSSSVSVKFWCKFSSGERGAFGVFQKKVGGTPNTNI